MTTSSASTKAGQMTVVTYIELSDSDDFGNKLSPKAFYEDFDIDSGSDSEEFRMLAAGRDTKRSDPDSPDISLPEEQLMQSPRNDRSRKRVQKSCCSESQSIDSKSKKIISQLLAPRRETMHEDPVALDKAISKKQQTQSPKKHRSSHKRKSSNLEHQPVDSNAEEMFSQPSSDDSLKSLVPRMSEASKNSSSAYAYNGPLKILSFKDLGDEAKKNFCFFCAQLLENIKDHFLQEHTDNVQVAFINSLDINKQQDAFWKYLIQKGNDVHNNSRAAHTRTGYIIPARLAYRTMEVREMKMCPDCRSWLVNGSLYLHARTCPVKDWNTQFDAYLESSKSNRESSTDVKLRSLLQSKHSRVLLQDPLCLAYLSTIVHVQTLPCDKLLRYMDYLQRLLRYMKEQDSSVFTSKDALSLSKARILATVVRAMAFERGKINVEMAEEITHLLIEMSLEAMLLARYSDEKSEIEKLSCLLQSEIWTKVISKPIK